MTSFPGSPRLTKGAIVGLDPFNPIASVVVFQYNPATLTRTLTPQMSGNNGNRNEVVRLSGPPAEKIKLDIEIDATDQLEKSDTIATGMGIYPQLSALEMLIYPKSSVVIANTILMAIGTIETIPVEAPLTLFIWGAKRILPVRLSEFSITEEAHDVNLNPIRAKVQLGLNVLSYNDFPITNIGYGVFLAHQVVKEAMAVVGSVSNLGSVGSVF
ncbi:MAG: hypothetical protein OEZ39_05710 [Gammaproteobacteria bacterium]|nr:hypothetical protein [Gammaproteobacteria bacterium]MDH5651351.1 hypothetical protein [Gammaproteobacteria bacterium]